MAFSPFLDPQCIKAKRREGEKMRTLLQVLNGIDDKIGGEIGDWLRKGFWALEL